MNAAKTIQVKGRLMSFDVPKVMGIVNITPDSFYGESRKTLEKDIVSQVAKMLAEGADMIDIGAVSTRPGSEEVSEEEERRRLQGIFPLLGKEFPDAIFSLDTFRAGIAEEFADHGVAVVNDISGAADPRMVQTIARIQVPYVLMHMRGTPQTMGGMTQYEKFPEELVFELARKYRTCRLAGINDIIIDPGFGFAKTITQNFQLMDQLEHLRLFESPVLVGISRKKTIHKTLWVTPEEALNGTTFMHAVALERGADILRVHDVKAAVECLKLYAELKK